MSSSRRRRLRLKRSARPTINSVRQTSPVSPRYVLDLTDGRTAFLDEKLNADRAKRDEKRREERRAQEASKRNEVNQQLLEEAQAPAFEREIEDCRNLILFFQQRIGQAPTEASTAANGTTSLFSRPQVAGVPKLEMRKVEDEPPKGTVLRKKGEQQEDVSGWGGVKNKKKGGKNNKGTEGTPAAASANDQLLNLPFGTLAALMGLGITAPLTTKDVSRTIENLELKKKYFVDNQVSQSRLRIPFPTRGNTDYHLRVPSRTGSSNERASGGS